MLYFELVCCVCWLVGISSQLRQSESVSSKHYDFSVIDNSGTGLCSYRIRGIDGSYVKHLTVESYMVIYATNSYTYHY